MSVSPTAALSDAGSNNDISGDDQFLTPRSHLDSASEGASLSSESNYESVDSGSGSSRRCSAAEADLSQTSDLSLKSKESEDSDSDSIFRNLKWPVQADLNHYHSSDGDSHTSTAFIVTTCNSIVFDFGNFRSQI